MKIKTPNSSKLRSNFIEIKGASTHNLKNLDINIPHRSFVVVTGLSGSGKTSLVFDTIFADWEAKYLQTFNAYARQFMGKIQKPKVEHIKGILPSISMKQVTQPPHPRARIISTADLYPYFRILFTQLGKTFSPISGMEVRRDDIDDVVALINSFPNDSKVLITTSLLSRDKDEPFKKRLEIERSKGFSRIFFKGQSYKIDDILSGKLSLEDEALDLMIDRFILPQPKARLQESIRKAFFEGNGRLSVHNNNVIHSFSNRFEADGITFLEPSIKLFDFNSSLGACGICQGVGKCKGVDPKKVIPNPALSLLEGSIAPWHGESMGKWLLNFIKNNEKFPINKPYQNLSSKEKELLWNGSKKAQGINSFFEMIEKGKHKMAYRVLYSRYSGFKECMSCAGTGLCKEANYIKVGGKTLGEVLCLSVEDSSNFFETLSLTTHEAKLTKSVLGEIKGRLTYLKEVGLSYLVLNRATNTLSGGEYQRVRLSRAMGSKMVDVLYILDEPSSGLHSCDSTRLINFLKGLQKSGNSVIVVEHDETIMHSADQIIDIGPGAGSLGGELVFQGSWENLKNYPSGKSITVDYLTGNRKITDPPLRKKSKEAICFKGIYENNLKGVDLNIPIQSLTVLSGVSGAGKSTLLKKVIYPGISNYLSEVKGEENFSSLSGVDKGIEQVEFMGQDAMGRSRRSSPVTYTKAFDFIRNLYAQQPIAAERGYGSSSFSVNSPGGRCDACEGQGYITLEMQFIQDTILVCDVCQGKRFQDELLDVTYNGKNIYEVLQMSVDEGLVFFENYPSIIKRIEPLQEVGLGYLKLGQPSSTLSGGEAQRVKLSSYLSSKDSSPTLFLFDEPTTGLHFHDIDKLLQAFHRLVNIGHTVVVVEHQLDIIKHADWVIDLGPEGGAGGGKIIFEGTPKEMANIENNETAKYLKEKFI